MITEAGAAAVSVLYSGVVASCGRQHADEAVIELLERNRRWLSGLDVLMCGFHVQSDPTVHSCAKIKSRLRLQDALPIALDGSGCMAFRHARLLLDWLIAEGSCRKALCILGEPEERDSPDGTGERAYRITVLRFAGSRHEITTDSDGEVKLDGCDS
ncbi:hypothetical protein KP806_08955 [Paenibacillus sp. N4]|uniref:hypothetical protein n=1 Tax=Paenibacillus vietnamensis TaxID=2590547 RepID=UPI001CD0B0B0|nr:hypothetical protein [Paenibacillus vietnamensis]MCA0755176.1 hypothetical protein [Paenibacillus vietnamensis]